ncbi:hypothetical protein BDZ91DRAFT_788735 [Kalaharituber pfeilii]|nr:hypothetical protein BDZ91DRAFT_788735 [Kalaharituber pfeilii]
MSSSTSTSNQTKEITFLPTSITYTLWSQTYDTDGNVLQQLDDEYLSGTALPLLRDLITAEHGSNRYNGGKLKELRALDFGCGTGRNTEKLVRLGLAQWVIGMDGSEGMLARARERLAPYIRELPRSEGINEYVEDSVNEKDQRRVRVDLIEYILPNNIDQQKDSAPPSLLPPLLASFLPADIVISTLVLEHIPLVPFFTFISWCLPDPKVRPSYFILTNMHPDMSELQGAAGFKDKDGKKIRPMDMWIVGGEEVMKVAWEVAGLKLVGDKGMTEVGVNEGDVQRLGERSRKWVGKRMLLAGVFTREKAGKGGCVEKKSDLSLEVVHVSYQFY